VKNITFLKKKRVYFGGMFNPDWGGGDMANKQSDFTLTEEKLEILSSFLERNGFDINTNGNGNRSVAFNNKIKALLKDNPGDFTADLLQACIAFVVVSKSDKNLGTPRKSHELSDSDQGLIEIMTNFADKKVRDLLSVAASNEELTELEIGVNDTATMNTKSRLKLLFDDPEFSALTKILQFLIKLKPNTTDENVRGEDALLNAINSPSTTLNILDTLGNTIRQATLPPLNHPRTA
jgi:hypothetical protein